MSVLGSCEKSCDHLRQDNSIEHRGSFSHGPKSPTSQRPKSTISQGSPSTKAPLDKNDKDSPVKMNAASVVQVGMMEIGTKRLRAKEASEEENNRVPKRFCKPVFSVLADSVLEPV
nr:hypothetical protein CFP56_59275 [Quercus suber]POE81945.1 hypothetical protein CFP56_77163 [Quercus suber]